MKPKRAAAKRPKPAAMLRRLTCRLSQRARLDCHQGAWEHRHEGGLWLRVTSPRPSAPGDLDHGAQREEAWNPRLVARLQAFANAAATTFGTCDWTSRAIHHSRGRSSRPAGHSVRPHRELCRDRGSGRLSSRGPGRGECDGQQSGSLNRAVPSGIGRRARLGGYSNRLGLTVKKRLLALEAEDRPPTRRAKALR